jgi:hypothetical protein
MTYLPEFMERVDSYVALRHWKQDQWDTRVKYDAFLIPILCPSCPC